MTTIADVAARAGVSKATVSRVFSRPEVVRPETREHVLKVAGELAFAPSRVARSLATGRTGSIGLFVPDVANPYFAPVIKAVQREARRRDLIVFTADSDESETNEAELAEVMARQADGLLLFSPRMPNSAILDLAGRVPLVVVNREIPGVPAVLIRSEEGITQAVEHLAALGHRRIAYVAGPRISYSNRARRAAVRSACRRFDIGLEEIGPFEPLYTSGVRAGDLLIASGVTAAIVYNDLMALGVLQRVSERGLKVGYDLSVVGFDDIWLAPVTQPPLTTVHAPAAAAATRALDWLLERIGDTDNRRQRPIRMTCDLVVRSSTGPAPR